MINDPFQRLGLDRQALSVSQLNNRARLLLEDVFAQVWVEGEISNLARPASGHIYFTLKDSQAQVRCALFRQHAARVRQALRDGLLLDSFLYREDCIRIAPPLVITVEQIKEACRIFITVLDSYNQH